MSWNLAPSFESIGHFVNGFCRYSTTLFVQVGLLTIVLLVIDRLMRRRVRAVFRYWMWSIVLVKLILPPTVSLPTGIGYWCTGYLSQSDKVETISAPKADMGRAVAVSPVMAADGSPLSAWPPGNKPADPRRVTGGAGPSAAVPALQAAGRGGPDGVAEQAEETVAAGSRTAPAPQRHEPYITWRGALFLLWLAGVVGLIGLFTNRLSRIHAVVQQAARPDRSLAVVFEECRRALGMRRPVDFLVSDRIAGPVALGVFRPVVLLPAGLAERLTPDQVRAVLLHELTHVARGDLVVHAVQAVLQILHFYNPFVWLANARIRAVREQAVDEAVLVAMGRDPAAYGSTLLAVADLARMRPLPGLGLLGVVENGGSLRGRIQHMLSRPVPRHARLGTAGFIVVVALAIALVPMAGAKEPAPKVADAPAANRTQGTRPAAAAPASEEPGFEPRGVLSGRITDEKGKPVTDARVQLGREREYHHAKTNSQGIYSFDKIDEAGVFRMYIQSREWVGTQGFEDQPTVELRPDKQVVHHLKLKRGCSALIEVVDEEDEPIPGVRLTIAPTGRDTRLNYTQDVKTDLEGVGHIGGAPAEPQPYMVTATHDDYAYGRVLVKLSDPDREAKGKIKLVKGVEVRGRAICSDGKPAEGWSISATPDWWHSGYCAEDVPIDEEGLFTLEHIAPGTYSMAYSIRAADGRGSTSYPLGSQKLPLKDGRLELKIPRPSPASSVEISGTITFTGGEPKQHFSVSARSKSNQFYHESLSPDSRTFTLEQLPPGRYELRFESTEFREKVISNVKAPTSDLAVNIEVVGKPVITFAVVDAADSKPVQSYRARLRKIRTISGPNYVPSEQWTSVSEPGGRGRLEAVGPGVYEVQVAAEGYAWTTSRQVNTETDKANEVPVALTRGVTLTGRVLNEKGKPVSGAKVIPLSQARGVMPPRDNSFVTDAPGVQTADGRFTLKHLEPGSETLKITHPDYCFTIVEDIKLNKTGDTPELTVTLRPGGTIAGQVYDADGKPAALVSLHVQDDYAYSGNDEEAGRLASVTTDANGQYEVRHLPEQMCFIRRANYHQVKAGVAICAAFPRSGQTRTVDLGGGPAITGRIMIDGKPVAGSLVQVAGPSPHAGSFRAFAATDANGSFVLRGTPPGVWHLYYANPDKPQDFLLARRFRATGADQDLGVLTNPTGAVTITLSDSPEKAWNVMLTERCPDSFFGSQAGSLKPRSAGDDPFVFERVPFGEYMVIAMTSDDQRIMLEPITLSPGKPEASLHLEFPTGHAAIAGKLDEAVRAGRMGLLLAVWHPERRFGKVVNQSEQPEYRVEGLPPGEYVLTDLYSMRSKPIRELALQDGQTLTLDLDPATCGMPPSATNALGMLKVCVVSEFGLPVPGVDAYLEGPGGRVRSTVANDWMLMFPGQAGEYTLHASYPGLGSVAQKVQLKRGPSHGLPMAPGMVVAALSN